MSLSIRRRLQPQARRQEIVEAAERLLRAQGSAVRVEDVVREAGAAKGTFYLYFPTWDDLLELLRQRIIAAFQQAHPMPVESKEVGDWPMTLENFAVAFVDATIAMGGLHDAIFHGDFPQRRPMSGDVHPVGRLAALIRAGQENAAFADVDPDPVARLLFAVIHETVDAILAGEDRERALAAMGWVLRRTLARELAGEGDAKPDS